VRQVRLVALPSLTLALILYLRHVSMIQLDPIAAFVLCVQSSMPSAQNLVLLTQLTPATRPLAGKVRRRATFFQFYINDIRPHLKKKKSSL
jgi:predicted permease